MDPEEIPFKYLVIGVVCLAAVIFLYTALTPEPIPAAIPTATTTVSDPTIPTVPYPHDMKG